MYPSYWSLGSTLTDCLTLTSTPKKFKLRLHCNKKNRQIMELEKKNYSNEHREERIYPKTLTVLPWVPFEIERIGFKGFFIGLIAVLAP